MLTKEGGLTNILLEGPYTTREVVKYLNYTLIKKQKLIKIPWGFKIFVEVQDMTPETQKYTSGYIKLKCYKVFALFRK